MKKFKESIDALEHALTFADKAKKDDFYASGIAKKFEICFEYTWKYFKQRANAEGLEVFSPKEAIKLAGRMGLIDNVEKWLNFLEDRNIGVHDYLGMPEDRYLKTIQEFFREVKKIKII